MTAKFILVIYLVHLGNVRLTYADTDGNGSINPSSEIISEKNYYPFGLQQKGYNNTVSSNVNSVANKFSYNGKENNPELGLEWYDFGARNYEESLGRWMNIDPLAARYDAYSPYSFTINNPIYYVDPDGKQIIIYFQSGGRERSYTYEYQKDRKNNNGPEFLQNTITALDALYEASNIDTDDDGEVDTNIFDDLMSSSKELSIVSSNGRSPKFAKGKNHKGRNGNIGTISYEDGIGVLFDDVNDSNSQVLQEQLDNGTLPPSAKVNSPTSLLGHEGLHTWNYLNRESTTREDGSHSNSYEDRRRDKSIRNETPAFSNGEEKRATTLSSQINRNLGEAPRTNHRGLGVPVQGVRSNKIKE